MTHRSIGRVRSSPTQQTYSRSPLLLQFPNHKINVLKKHPHTVPFLHAHDKPYNDSPSKVYTSPTFRSSPTHHRQPVLSHPPTQPSQRPPSHTANTTPNNTHRTQQPHTSAAAQHDTPRRPSSRASAQESTCAADASAWPAHTAS